MPFLKKFLCIFSLRLGSILMAYLGLIYAMLPPLWIMFTKYDFCGVVMYIWLISSGWNIMSDVVLLIAIYRNNPNLLPLHLVICLIGLILEMISHMLIANSGIRDNALVVYAFVAIGYILADTVIVLSYFQSEK